MAPFFTTVIDCATNFSDDVAFLPSFGNLCFFNAASTTSRPMSPVGKITENITALSNVKSGDQMRVYLDGL